MRVVEIHERFGLDALRITERAETAPETGFVRVRMQAWCINYRDLLVVKGLYNPKMPLPRIPLSDGMGTVEAVGSGVTRVQVGDRVAGSFMQTWVAGEVNDNYGQSALGGAIDGVLAESCLFHEEGLVHVPAHLSDEEAATLPCAGVTAWHATVGLGVKPGDTVLLLGTGGVSLFALQFAKLCGARTIITSSSDEKLTRARSLGADDGINYRHNPEWDREVRKLTDGRGVDLVVEVGGAGTLPLSMKAARAGGRIALIGVLAAGTVNPLPAVMKALNIQGIYVGSRTHFEEMNRAISLHQLRPVIDRHFGFEELAAALEHLESGAHFGKIVLKLT